MKKNYSLASCLLFLSLCSLPSHGMNCPKSPEGIENLSKNKRLKCTIYKIGILERYLDDQNGYDWVKKREDIAGLVNRFKGMEGKVRGRYENFCMSSLKGNRAEKKKCLDDWMKSIR